MAVKSFERSRQANDWIAGCTLRRCTNLKKEIASVLRCWKVRAWAGESGSGWEKSLPRMWFRNSGTSEGEWGTAVTRRNLPSLSGIPFLFILMGWYGRRWSIFGRADAAVFQEGGPIDGWVGCCSSGVLEETNVTLVGVWGGVESFGWTQIYGECWVQAKSCRQKKKAGWLSFLSENGAFWGTVGVLLRRRKEPPFDHSEVRYINTCRKAKAIM